MKVSTVLLRWYKSFNVNYTGYTDRKAGVASRPWNLLGRDTDSQDDFPFIEIPLEGDITTIVGANESGKSHLLSAISKVITGKGIPEQNGESSNFSRIDLCHYTSPRNKNAKDWPNIGLQFTSLSQEELQAIGTAADQADLGKTAPSANYTLTLVIAPNNEGTQAYLYPDSTKTPFKLNTDQLKAVRKCLPKVEFIKSTLAIADQIPIGTLLSAFGRDHNNNSAFDFQAAQAAAELIESFALSKDGAIGKDVGQKLFAMKEKLVAARIDADGKCELELQLFRDVLGINDETLDFLAGLNIAARTHADGLTTRWNREIEQTLNLSHYWQQDDSFALGIDYRQGILYFEITDKTGATYTFKERSSGLRYFLSYYIQAKALEITSKGRDTLVLMDEPDSFLSILGQRNLLAVFESLVRAESSHQHCQLVYTTHSPFLINRNYPRRLRLVKKGDAEEGTQVIDRAMLRRYEPVRSALGVDCAQTLFMGATNVVVEGPVDQYIICELIRIFITPDNVGDLLDLNSIVMVSADSAPGIEKLLHASAWGDEPTPATVVLLDSDTEGDKIRERIIGKARKCKKLIEEPYVLQVASVLGDAKPGQKFVTTEDLIPHKLYVKAVLEYVKQWHPEVDQESVEALQAEAAHADFAVDGIVAGTTAAMNKHVHSSDRDYDKFGVMQIVVELIERNESSDEERKLLKQWLTTLCHEVRRKVSASQQVARRITGKQAIQRLIKDFFVTNKQSTTPSNLQLLLERLKRDTELLGLDGEKLDGSLSRMLSTLKKMRGADQQSVSGGEWTQWRGVLEAIRKNPLSVEIRILENNPIISSDSDFEAEGQAETTPPAKPDNGQDDAAVPKPVSSDASN